MPDKYWKLRRDLRSESTENIMDLTINYIKQF